MNGKTIFIAVTIVGVGCYSFLELLGPWSKRAPDIHAIPRGAAPAFAVPASGANSAVLIVRPDMTGDEAIHAPTTAWLGATAGLLIH